MPKLVSKTFTTRAEFLRNRLAWVIADIPLDVRKVWASGRVRVRGEINGFPFRSTTFARRDGTHFLLLNKKVQKGAVVRPGDTIKVRLENDPTKRTFSVPPELEHEFKQSKAMRKWFDNLSGSIRNYISAQVQQPKSAEARKRRAEQMAEALYSAMDAERDLPPLLRHAFTMRPKAYEGWQSMTPTAKRHRLLSIFAYRSPEARERRIEKMLEEAEARTEKHKGM